MTFVYPDPALRNKWLTRSMWYGAESDVTFGFATAIREHGDDGEIVSVGKWVASPFLNQSPSALAQLFWFAIPLMLFHPSTYQRLHQYATLYTSLRPDVEQYMQLNGLVTHRNHRRRGYATKLLECGLCYARASDWPVFLFCWDEMTPYYARFGFESVTDGKLPGHETTCHGMLWTP